ncbi:MAG TPA: DUF4215 domain-containing protein [Nannocystis sp.]|jgi:cysteine-rich repeat protein
MKHRTRLLDRVSRVCAVVAGSVLTSACFVSDIEAIIADYEVTEAPGSSDEGSSSQDASTGTSTGMTADSTGGPGTSTSGVDETTSTGSGSGDSSSTGTTGPVCGDGLVEGDETCDDGNDIPGDGCQSCAADSIVFITSERYQGFKLGGLYGADQRCRNLAAKAGLARPLTFMAWLSTSTMSVADRMLHSRGRYVLVNGLVVAQDWDALTSGTLETPIAVTEYSETREDLVWTGTLPGGQPSLGSDFCGDWDDPSAFNEDGGSGYSLATDAWWSFFDHNGCISELPLYCVEQREAP